MSSTAEQLPSKEEVMRRMRGHRRRLRRFVRRDVVPAATRTGMRVAYRALSILPRRHNKAVFLSRQSNAVPYDYQLAIDHLVASHPGVEVSTVSCRFNPDNASRLDQLGFAWATARSLYHLATAKAAVLDSYWPSVSLVDLGDGITVFQMWHSLGKVKKSGVATLDKPHGRSAHTAESLAMHQGYDYVLAGAPSWNKHYLESFPIRPEQILNIGLPRASYLVSGRAQVAERIYESHPELREGNVVLYAPTFRRGGGAAFGADRIVNNLSKDGWQVIVKGHANQSLLPPRKTHHECRDFTAAQLLTVADYLVTDYSAIAIEAALLDVPTYYYLHDLDRYLSNNGLNIDIEKEMPGCAFRRIRHLSKAMKKPYPHLVLQAYKEKFVLQEPELATQRFIEALIEKGGLCLDK